ncbi:MAG: ComEC/Rec2 family competence protein [Bacteroidota bacterium]
MAYEIDFLPVGEGERSGDAIALRVGDFSARDKQLVLVIDGGTKESGEQLVKHIKRYYQTDDVDLVVCTHSDADHASGLTEVLENLSVGQFWMHLPWEHTDRIRSLFKDGRLTVTGLREKFRKSLETARELKAIAKRKGIPIVEPFSDKVNRNNILYVLSPSTAYYESLLPNFRIAPEPKEEVGVLEKVVTAAREVVTRVAENWGLETLTDPEEDASSAENNSGAVLRLQFDGKQFLFTADAGVPALTEAANYADGSGIDLKACTFIQIPHHGSRRNVGPTILNRILGPRGLQQSFNKTACVSASKGGEPKHPSKRVVNACKRRRAEVYATQGITLCYHSDDAPDRGWGKADPLPFYNEVED